MTAVADEERARAQTIRARNRALVAVLVALVAIFYVVTIVRIRG